jgi:hypothetical protein
MQNILTSELQRRKAAPASYPEGRFAGRGIVTCAGGQRYFTCVWMLVWTLRRVLGCTLPIQVWHLGRREISEGMQAILEEQGVEVVDAEQMISRHPARVSGGWPLKPYAIANSRFQEVLFLDADTIPLVDPATVFRWEVYAATGALFWPDLVDLTMENGIWSKVGLPPRDCISFESSVMALNKRRCWTLLDIAILLNEHWEDVYGFLHGDKDTFLVAAELSGTEVALLEHRPYPFDKDLIQRDPGGDPFVHHRTLSKWNFAGVNRPVCDPRFADACDRALADLRSNWTGALFHPPARSIASSEAENRLIAARVFSYSTSVVPQRTLELLSGGRVGEGRAEYEQHWAVVESPQGLVLQFFSTTQLTIELRPCADGSWTGASRSSPAFDATLVSHQDHLSWPWADQGRVERSSLLAVKGLFDNSLLRGGFDPDVADQLRSALSYLNRGFDDVPERLVALLEGEAVDQDWSAILTSWVASLSDVRDARLQATRDRAVHPRDIDPKNYRRVK